MYTFQICRNGKTVNLTVMQDRYKGGSLRLAMFLKDVVNGSSFYGDLTHGTVMLDNKHAFVLEGDNDRQMVMDTLQRLGAATPTNKIGKSKDGTKRYRIWYFHADKLERYCSKSRTLQKVEVHDSISTQLRVLKDMGKITNPPVEVALRKKLYTTCKSSIQVEAAVHDIKIGRQTIGQFLDKQ